VGVEGLLTARDVGRELTGQTGRARGAVAPAAVVLLALVALPAIFGAPLGQVLLYLGEEVGFALAPGMALYLALAGVPSARVGGGIRLAGVGYALGLVLQVAAFGLTAALHARWLLWAYPPAVLLACAPAVRRSLRRFAFADSVSPQWGLAAVCLVALVWVSVAYFPYEPLPSPHHSVVYVPDLVFHLGVAAEALHHWPITDPKVSGTPLPYELFVYMKLAASAQTTHIPLATILFRVYLLPLIAAIAALLYCLGLQVSGRRSAGVLAAALFLLVGQLGLAPRDSLLFYNTVFFSLYDSPSYSFGLVLFLGALCVLCDCLSARSVTVGRWTVLALLLAGCSGAKAAILPDLIGALVILLVLRRDRSRAVWALLLTGAIFGISYVVLYHGGTGGLSLHLPGSIRSMDFTTILHSRSGLPAVLFWAIATIVGLIGFCGATLAGVPLALSRRASRSDPRTVLLLGLFLASLVPFLTLTHKGGSQNFFTYYGICGACVLSGWGLSLALGAARADRRRLGWLAGAWLLLLLAAAVVPYELSANPSEPRILVLWLGLPAACVVGLLVAAWRRRGRRPVLVALALVLVTVNGALDTPLHVGDVLVPPLLHGRSLYVRDSPAGRGLTPALFEGLTWMREHVPTDAVVAVNNQFSDSMGRVATYYYYSAFGEHRVFLEGWYDTVPAAGTANPEQTPFPLRLFLNDALFRNGSPAALAVMERRYGVRYLLVDLAHGPVPPGLPRLGRVIFRNRGMILARALPVA
jgi:hypothetical protein